jgi:type II secretory pathway pseudopilin PulG
MIKIKKLRILLRLRSEASKSQKLRGITLIEILIAISLLTLVIFAGSAIYLSGWNMFRDAQARAQAARNATIPMMHVQKELINYIELVPEPPAFVAPGATIPFNFRYTVYPDPPNFPNPTFIEHIYSYDPDTDQLAFDSIIIGRNITAFSITENTDHDDLLLNIQLSATDNNGGNTYTLENVVEPRHRPKDIP